MDCGLGNFLQATWKQRKHLKRKRTIVKDKRVCGDLIHVNKGSDRSALTQKASHKGRQ